MKAAIFALVSVLALPATGSTADEPVGIEMTPRTCVAPCSVRLSIRIPVDSANRSVTITADSADFYRSSTRQLEGNGGPVHHELLLEALPTGQYEIRVTVDRNGDEDPHRQRMFRVHGDADSMERAEF